jgi:SAM-dependent methyltransferase
LRHLDCMELYNSPRQYDIEYDDLKDDIPYYLDRIAPKGSSVLELACGTGRVTMELAKAGFSMTGLDISEAMLSTAKAKAAAEGLGEGEGGIRWVLGDCRSFRFDRKFPWVIFPFNSLCHLHHRESVEACFARVREHLLPHGTFLLDLVNPSYELLTCDPDENPPVMEYYDEDAGGIVVIREHAEYHQISQVKRITWTYWHKDELLKTSHLTMRLFYPQEIDALLYYNGFEVIERTGDYRSSRFIDYSPRQMLVCKPI